MRNGPPELVLDGDRLGSPTPDHPDLRESVPPIAQQFVELYFDGSEWRPAHKGWNLPSVKDPGLREVFGIMLYLQYLILDHDPRNNPDVYADMEPWLGDDPHVIDTLRQTTPRNGLHLVFEIPGELEGRIKQKPFRHAKGVDVKPGFDPSKGKFPGHVKTGEGYQWAGTAILPLPEPLVRYFREEAERTTVRDNGFPVSSASDTAAVDEDPIQEYDAWLNQLCRIVRHLKSKGMADHDMEVVVEEWNRRGAKYDRERDRKITKGVIEDAWTLEKKKVVNGFTEHRKYLAMARVQRVSEAWIKFWLLEKTVGEISVELDVGVRQTRKYLLEYIESDRARIGRGYTFVISRVRNGTVFFEVCRLLRLGRKPKWIVEKTGVPRTTFYNWKREWEKNPILGLTWKQAKKEIFRMNREDARKKKPPMPSSPKPRNRVRVRALYSENVRMGEWPSFYSEKERREVVGWWDGVWLTLDEKTERGKLRRKRASSVVWTWRVDAPEPRRGTWVLGSKEPVGLERFADVS